DDGVQPEARHPQPADGIAFLQAVPVALRGAEHRLLLLGHRYLCGLPAGAYVGCVGCGLALVGSGEPPLLAVRGERRGRVLPLPDDERPEHGDEARRGANGADDAERAPHDGIASFRLCVRAAATTRPIGPRAGRSALAGYGP